MSFARRRKATFRTDSLDLPSLLAQLGARQAASRTARIQSRITIDTPKGSDDPRVDIFAPEGNRSPETHRFSDGVATTVTSRQSK